MAKTHSLTPAILAKSANETFPREEISALLTQNGFHPRGDSNNWYHPKYPSSEIYLPPQYEVMKSYTARRAGRLLQAVAEAEGKKDAAAAPIQSVPEWATELVPADSRFAPPERRGNDLFVHSKEYPEYAFTLKLTGHEQTDRSSFAAMLSSYGGDENTPASLSHYEKLLKDAAELGYTRTRADNITQLQSAIRGVEPVIFAGGPEQVTNTIETDAIEAANKIIYAQQDRIENLRELGFSIDFDTRNPEEDSGTLWLRHPHLKETVALPLQGNGWLDRAAEERLDNIIKSVEESLKAERQLSLSESAPINPVIEQAQPIAEILPRPIPARTTVIPLNTADAVTVNTGIPMEQPEAPPPPASIEPAVPLTPPAQAEPAEIPLDPKAQIFGHFVRDRMRERGLDAAALAEKINHLNRNIPELSQKSVGEILWSEKKLKGEELYALVAATVEHNQNVTDKGQAAHEMIGAYGKMLGELNRAEKRRNYETQQEFGSFVTAQLWNQGLHERKDFAEAINGEIKTLRRSKEQVSAEEVKRIVNGECVPSTGLALFLRKALQETQPMSEEMTLQFDQRYFALKRSTPEQAQEEGRAGNSR